MDKIAQALKNATVLAAEAKAESMATATVLASILKEIDASGASGAAALQRVRAHLGAAKPGPSGDAIRKHLDQIEKVYQGWP